MDQYRDGTDLILGIMKADKFVALGHSDECKISYKSETGDRTTKEETSKKWKEKYVKSLSVSISASGFVYVGDGVNIPELEDLFLAHEPVEARWGFRDEVETVYHTGSFVISSLDDEGKAGDDEKYSLSLENSGAITKVKPTA